MPILATNRRPKSQPREPGLKVPCTELAAAIRQLEREGKRVVSMSTKREGCNVNYYLTTVDA